MSTHECGLMSTLAYDAPNVPSGYQVGGLNLVRQTATAGCYNSAAFCNRSANSVVIASIETHELNDFGNDVDVSAGFTPAQAADAKTFTDDTPLGLKAAGVNDPYVTFTGHSLGGHLAEGLQDSCPGSKSVTFQSPGKWSFIGDAQETPPRGSYTLDGCACRFSGQRGSAVHVRVPRRDHWGAGGGLGNRAPFRAALFRVTLPSCLRSKRQRPRRARARW